ncbi:hypothetical protein LSAT2_029733 [Lamellibrachia satsuma]|nr:hypothetical protein LSAT2_029733 [Lamellibrachia satsuma]
MIVRTNTVDTLNMSGNNLTDKESPHLASMIKGATELRELSLSHNELRERGGLNIGDAIAKNSSIDVLDLSWNHLRCKGAESISMGLLNNFTITTLNLAWNGFGFEGCVAMAHALHANRTLVELDLSSNRIHTPALFELTNGLVLNNTLETLRLGANPIPSIATTPFLSRLQAAPHMALTLLDLSKIIVDTDFEPMVEEIRLIRPDFTVIYDHSLPINKDKLKKDFDPKVILNVDPVRLLYFTKKNMRIIDFFNKIDKDRNYTLSREEIRQAMQGDNISLSSSAMDTIMDYIDVNKDGEIDLREFAEAERRFKRMTQQTLKKQEERARLEAAQGEIDTALCMDKTAEEGGVPLPTSIHPSVPTILAFDNIDRQEDVQSKNVPPVIHQIFLVYLLEQYLPVASSKLAIREKKHTQYSRSSGFKRERASMT